MKYKLLFVLSILCHCSFGQIKVGYWLDSEVVRVPFEIVNHSIFVKVDLNENKDLSFIVDTGSSFSVSFIDSLMQVAAQYRGIRILGFGKLDSIPAYVSVYNTLSLGGLKSYGQQVLVIEKDKVGFQQFFDRSIDGIIGLDILRNFDLELNFAAEQLVFRKNTREGIKKKRNKKWIDIPLIISRNAIYVPAVLSVVPDQKDSVVLVMDTGAHFPLIMQERFCPPDALRTIIGLGFLGYTTGKISKISNFSFGGIELKEVITAFPDSTSVTWNPLLPHQGNLGIQFLKGYRIHINYKDQYMQLKPIKKSMGKPFAYNRSGMAIGSRTRSKECAFYIMEIVAESPAEIAGFLKGDRIMNINNTSCPKLTLEIIDKHLYSSNPSIEISIQRGDLNLTKMLDLSNK